MAKISKKEELIKFYPQYEAYIREQWDWYEGKDEFGREVWSDEFDIPKTQTNIFEAVRNDVEIMFEEELLQLNMGDMIFDNISGEFMSKKDLTFYAMLSNEQNSIYGS
jgi:hypothetical protein